MQVWVAATLLSKFELLLPLCPKQQPSHRRHFRPEAISPWPGRIRPVTTAVQPASSGMVDRPSPTGLADVIDTILDKGLVIDAYVRVSLVGIEVLTIDARIVVASVDTYLRFAEAVNRLDISGDKKDLPGLIGDMEEGGAKRKTRGALDAAGDKVRGATEELSDQASGRGKRSRRD
jgi:hypothetical protein